ncbi:Isopenicillin N synthase-like [Sesbania bispinosa]|nr:Isopenicillin N synthase-like [Sesbania bispinosa]
MVASFCCVMRSQRGELEELFKALKALFDLPEETKQRHVCPKPYRSYLGKCPVIPLSESFGIDDAPLPAMAQAFTHNMWPQGNPVFCETLKSMSSKMLNLCFLIMKMITKGYVLPQHYISDVENMKSSSNSRLMKYKDPENSSNDASEVALIAHTDKSALAILCQNEVQATHRVMMRGDKERYSFGLFALPKEDVVIKVPHELVDDEIHPLRYKPFKYGEYFNYHVSTLKENALEAFAGL